MLRACAKCGRYHEASAKCIGSSGYKLPRTNEQALRNKHAWRKKSESIREQSFYICAICAKNGDFSYKDVEVHHIRKLRDNPELLLDDSNLITLCIEHHKAADAGEIKEELLLELARKRNEENGGLFTI